MILQKHADGEAASKRRRTTRKHWIVLTEGQKIEARAIKQTMRGPKLLSNAMPRVILKEDYLQRPRSAESEIDLKFVSSRTMRIEALRADIYGQARAGGMDIAAAESKATNATQMVGEGKAFGLKYTKEIFQTEQRRRGRKLFAKKPSFVPNAEAARKMVTATDSPFMIRVFEKTMKPFRE